MGSFVFFAALLGLIAIAFAIATLWQRSRGLAIGLAMVLPLSAAGLYFLRGEPAALDPANIRTPTTVEEAVVQLQHRLAGEPGTFENLVLLARSFMAVEKFSEARDTYARALKLKPDDVDVAVEYAESLLRTSSDHRFPPKAVALLERAVEKNPENQRALFFLGMQRFQAGKPAEAAGTWEKLLPLLQPDAAAALRSQIDNAREQSGLAPLPQADAGDALVSIEISIDGLLAGQAREGDVLFVYARALEGVGPPLAAKRIVLGKLPLLVRLGDADSPMPTAKLSSQAQVVVMARLSRSGDAKSASGDIEADPVTVSTRAGSLTSLVLNRTVP